MRAGRGVAARGSTPHARRSPDPRRRQFFSRCADDTTFNGDGVALEQTALVDADAADAEDLCAAVCNRSLLPVWICRAHTRRSNAAARQRMAMLQHRGGGSRRLALPIVDAFAHAHGGRRAGAQVAAARAAGLLVELQRAEDTAAHWAVETYVSVRREPLSVHLRRELLACARAPTGDFAWPMSLACDARTRAEVAPYLRLVCAARRLASALGRSPVSLVADAARQGRGEAAVREVRAARLW